MTLLIVLLLESMHTVKGKLHIFSCQAHVKTGSNIQIFIHFGIPSNTTRESCLSHFGAKGIIIIFMNLLLFAVFFLPTSQTCILPEAKMITGF